MKSSIALRIFIDIYLLVLIIVSPWWCVVILTTLALLYFDWYIEALFIGFVLDALYGIGGFHNYRFLTYATIGVVTLLYVKQWIRTR